MGVFCSRCFQNANLTQPDYVIKGNVKDGHKIYFYPGCGNYSNVALELDQGDQWFCSESEARASGFIKTKKLSLTLTLDCQFIKASRHSFKGAKAEMPTSEAGSKKEFNKRLQA